MAGVELAMNSPIEGNDLLEIMYHTKNITPNMLIKA